MLLSSQMEDYAMSTQSLLQLRIDRGLKEEVSDIFAALGLDLSTAIRVFLQRCRAERGIPFALTLAEDGKAIRPGRAKGKWKLPPDWENLDKALDREIEADFHADSP